MRGVGDEFALLLHRALAFGPRGVEGAEHLIERPRQLADLVVAIGSGIRCEGSRVVAISWAVAVSEEIGRIARPAIATPAKTASRVPPKIAGGDQQPDPVDGRVDVVEAAPVLDVAGHGRRIPS